MTYVLEATVQNLSDAKLLAGEWIAQFNQDLDENDSPLQVTMESLGFRDERMNVYGCLENGEPINDEEVANAMDVLNDIEGATP